MLLEHMNQEQKENFALPTPKQLSRDDILKAKKPIPFCFEQTKRAHVEFIGSQYWVTYPCGTSAKYPTLKEFIEGVYHRSSQTRIANIPI